VDINISIFEREIAAEYLKLYEHEIREGGGDYASTISVMNIAATAAAIAIKQYHERLCKEQNANA